MPDSHMRNSGPSATAGPADPRTQQRIARRQAHASLTAWLPWLPEPPYVLRAALGGRARTPVYIAHPSSWGEPKTIRQLHGPQTLAQLRPIALGHVHDYRHDADYDPMTPPSEPVATGTGRADAGAAFTAGRISRPSADQGRAAGEPMQPMPGPLAGRG
ncbi:MAG TPA: hypothetical protein VF940_28830 [Streptosporangiaceae bacterium]